MAVADKLASLRIKADIIADKSIGLLDIEVDVHDGVAVLTGEVESEDQKQLAEEIASNIEGITEVENNITVLPPEHSHSDDDAHLGYSLTEGDAGDTAYSISGAYEAPGPGMPASEQFPGQFTDEEIEENVLSRLDSQTEIDTLDVRVHVENQVAHISGSVESPDDVIELLDIVTNARGVMGVKNEVRPREGEPGTLR